MKICTKCGQQKPSTEFPKRENRCTACRAAYHQAWYTQNRKRVLAKVRCHQQQHQEERRAYARRYYQSHKEQWLSWDDLSAEQRQQRRIRSQLWKITHRDQDRASRRISEAKRRARKRQNGSDLSSRQAQALLSASHCSYCGKSGTTTLDHFIPINAGGATTASNLVPACRTCNSSKGAKLLKTPRQLRLLGV